MPVGSPKLIAINHDDYHARHVGHLSDGRQFILTTPFDPANRHHKGCEFVALYLFDTNGTLLDTSIKDFGPRETVNEAERSAVHDRLLQGLGDVTFDRIEVAPFEVHAFGIQFGLIVRAPEEDGDVWAVEMQPGNYMAFFEPWDSGEYDT